VEAWKVHKFGGSSVADAACMERVARIVEDDPAPRKAVVLSACRGVTDALLTLVSLAEQQDPSLDDRIRELRDRHVGVARELLAGHLLDEFVAELDDDCRDVAGDLIAGYGEIWSTRLFRESWSARPASAGEVRWVDARQVVMVEWGPLGPAVQWPESRAPAAPVPADSTARS
jgi:bifunctional aspartokinase / homoserine dehydrogenase 1